MMNRVVLKIIDTAGDISAERGRKVVRCQSGALLFGKVQWFLSFSLVYSRAVRYHRNL